MKKDDLIQKFIEMNEKTITFMDKVSSVLEELNDNNKLHKQAIDVNTQATKEMTQITKEMIKHLNKIWYILFLVILALIVLAGAEKVLKFI